MEIARSRRGAAAIRRNRPGDGLVRGRARRLRYRCRASSHRHRSWQAARHRQGQQRRFNGRHRQDRCQWLRQNRIQGRLAAHGESGQQRDDRPVCLRQFDQCRDAGDVGRQRRRPLRQRQDEKRGHQDQDDDRDDGAARHRHHHSKRRDQYAGRGAFGIDLGRSVRHQGPGLYGGSRTGHRRRLVMRGPLRGFGPGRRLGRG